MERMVTTMAHSILLDLLFSSLVLFAIRWHVSKTKKTKVRKYYFQFNFFLSKTELGFVNILFLFFSSMKSL